MPGLRNLGNTCFAATVLQALASSPEVVLAISMRQPEISGHGFARASAELILRLAEERDTEKRNREIITPAAWIEQLRAAHRSIGFQQQDAEEVFLILASALFSKDEVYGRGGGRLLLPRSGQRDLGLAEIAELAEASLPLSAPQSIAIPSICPDPALHGNSIILRSSPAASSARDSEHQGTPEGTVPGSEGIFLAAHLKGKVQPLMEQPQELCSQHPLMGLLSSCLKCSVCGGQQECKIDTFCDISLTIPQQHGFGRGVLLDDCLQLWARDELVEGAMCDRCLLRGAMHILEDRKKTLESIPMTTQRRGELVSAIDTDIEMMQAVSPTTDHSAIALADALRQRCRQVVGDREAGRMHKCLRVARAPRTLCLHLRRVLPTRSGYAKDRTPVSFGPSLDLTPYLERFTESSGKADEPSRTGRAGQGQRRGARAQHSLLAVVVHMGDANGGHYICYCKVSDGAGGFRWLLYNDESVREVSMVDVLRAEPYLLFYERLPSAS